MLETFLLFTGSLTLLITLFVWRGKRDAIRQSFLLAGSGFSLWTISLVLMYMTQDFRFAVPTMYSPLLAFSGLLLLAKMFPEHHEPLSSRSLLYLAPAAGTALLVPSSLFIQDAKFTTSGAIEPILGPAFPLYLSVFLFYILTSLFVLVKKFRRLRGIEKTQMMYLFLGLFLTSSAGFIFDGLLPALGNYQYNVVGALSPIFFVGFTAYAIQRHELLDARIIIQRGLIYSVMFSLIVLFYIGSLLLVQLSLPVPSGVATLLAGGIVTIFGIFTVPRLERRFRKLSDRFFFKDKYDYQEALHQLSEVLNKNIEMNALLLEASETLQKIFRSKGAVVVLGADKGESCASPPCPNISLPIVSEDRTLGWIKLGEKLSSDNYTQEDIRLLKTFANQAGVALEKAALFEKMKNYSQELAVGVEQRTKQIVHMQEEQSQMMLDVAHSLQTPLTVLKGELESAKKGTPDKHKLGDLERTIDNVSKLVYDLLSLAALEMGAKDLQKERISLSQLLNELVEYFRTIGQEKEVVLEAAIEPDIFVLGNKEKLEELITNLVSNAFKYIGEKEKKVSIELTQTKEEAKLLVADFGIGIAESDLPHIFNRFYRVKQQSPGGGGLGLAIAKSIAEKHGGTISVKSAFGKGTQFFVTVPLAPKK